MSFNLTFGRMNLGGSRGDSVAPTITSSNTVSVEENATLAHALAASEPVTWSIAGGADQSHFEISGTTLRFLSDSTKDYESPGDEGNNNSYVLTVRATDAAANTTDQSITVSVTDVAEVTTYKHARLVINSYGSGGAFIATEVEFLTADDQDMSQSATAYGTNYQGGNPPANAFDNNGGSIFESTGATPSTVGCTLTSPSAITKVAMTTFGGYHNRCLRTGKLQGSNGTNYADGPWVDLVDIPDQGDIWGSGERRVFSN